VTVADNKLRVDSISIHRFKKTRKFLLFGDLAASFIIQKAETTLKTAFKRTMFGFFGGRNRKRQIQDADRKNREKMKHPQHGKQQQQQQQQHRSDSRKPNHFDDASLDMSLYTTPSKATLQYHRGVHNHHDWQSVDSAVTPEVAFVQSKLGGWEAPLAPAHAPRAISKDKITRRPSPRKRRHSARSNTSLPSSLREQSAKQPSSITSQDSNNKSTNFRIIDGDTDLSSIFHDTQSLDSNIRFAGPVDVDSLEIVEQAPPEKFSDLLSNFEARSLAGRMASNVAAMHYERANMSRVEGRTISRNKQQDCSSCGIDLSRRPSGSRSQPSRPTNCLNINSSASHMIPEDLPMVEYDDDCRSLVTEVSGLTMLTMEQQAVGMQSRKASTCGRQMSCNPILSSPTFGLSPSKMVPTEEVSFSGLLSRFDAESLADRLSPTTNTLRGRTAAENRTSESNDSDCQIEQERPRNDASDNNSSRGSMRSTRSIPKAPEEDYAATLKMSRLVNVAATKSRAATTVAFVSSLEPQTAQRNEQESRFKKESDHEHNGEANRQSPSKARFSHISGRQEKEKVTTVMKKKNFKSASKHVSERSLDRHTSISSETQSLGDVPEDISFSGLFSTIEAESLAGRLDASLSLQHLGGACSNESCNNDDSRAQDDDSIGMASLFSSFLQATVDAVPLKRTAKRSNVSSKASAVSQKSTSLPDKDSTITGISEGFSSILSVLEAQSAASCKLEPPVTKRLLPSGEFPITVHKSKGNRVNDEKSKHEEDQDHSEGQMQPVSPSDSSLEFHGFDELDGTDSIHTICDESTIPPSPLADDCSWNEALFSPPSNDNEPLAREALDSLAMDDMSTFSSMEEAQSDCRDSDSTCVGADYVLQHAQGGKQFQNPSKQQLTLVATETSLQYSESMGSSLQYSESTAPPNVTSDFSSLLASAEMHRTRSKNEQRCGLVDLDKTVVDTNSETSSLFGTASLPQQPTRTPFKSTEKMSSVASPLTNDDEEEDEHQFVDNDEELVGTDDEESSRSLPLFSKFHEALVERSYKETMDSLSSRHDAGSILLTEEELNKHVESAQFKEALPSSSLRGYDTWKINQYENQKYFIQVHKKAMQRKVQKKNPTGVIADRATKDGNSLGSTSILEQSMSSTMQTSLSSESMRRNNKVPLTAFKLGWNLFRSSGAQRQDEDTETTSHQGSWKSRSPKKKEPAVVSLEQFLRLSNDESDDDSHVPMNQLGWNGFNLTSSTIPTGKTEATTKFHYLNHHSAGPRLMALQYLETERSKNRHAEKDETKVDNREQRRIAMLKERELEQQRQLNGSRDHGQKPFIFKSKLDTSDQILQRNFSFGTTNTAQSSMRSPSCVLSPCIVCNAAERSHVAQPCMHFYFCEDCAHSLQASSTSLCPVCSAKNVSFSRVYT
jgi:hypothetical protein